ncbi:hypothetical protein HQ545_07305 [Candidatus Woesearchaeota archaeon]|nr:hypothetical protein [Candidatus Woesearchaeota archaeon]
MKLKIDEAIGSLDYRDLVDLHEDIREGGNSIRSIVEQKIVEKEKEQGKFCAICQSDIDPHSTTNYTILLGPEGLRRKASFCAIDCLKYFITSMENRRDRISEKMHKNNNNVCAGEIDE